MDLRTHRFKRNSRFNRLFAIQKRKECQQYVFPAIFVFVRSFDRSFYLLYSWCQTKAIRNILYFAMAMAMAMVRLCFFHLLLSIAHNLQFYLIACHQNNHKRATINSNWNTTNRISIDDIHLFFLNEILLLVEHGHFMYTVCEIANQCLIGCHLTCTGNEIYFSIRWIIGEEKYGLMKNSWNQLQNVRLQRNFQKKFKK